MTESNNSHLELVGGVEGHLHHFLEAITVVHDVPYSELSELQQSGLWRISHHNPLWERVKVRHKLHKSFPVII